MSARAEFLVSQFNRLVNGIFDACMGLLSLAGRWAEVAGAAMAVGAAVALIFALLLRRTSLRRAQDDLRSALFEIWLYRHDWKVVLSAEWDLFVANLRYIRAFFPPLCLAMIVVSPILIQAYHRFDLQPFGSGSAVVVIAELREPVTEFADIELALKWVKGSGSIDASVREPAIGRVVWRVVPRSPGRHLLRIVDDGPGLEFPIDVDTIDGSVAGPRYGAMWSQLLHPRGAPLSNGTRVEKIDVDYPHAPSIWLVWFTAISLVSAVVVNQMVRRHRQH